MRKETKGMHKTTKICLTNMCTFSLMLMLHEITCEISKNTDIQLPRCLPFDSGDEDFSRYATQRNSSATMS